MLKPDVKALAEVYRLVAEAERAWRDAWPEGIPALRTDATEISLGLSTAKSLLEKLLHP